MHNFNSFLLAVVGLTAAVLFSKPLYAEVHKIEGIVFIDENGNGVRNSKEKGLASVIVSDGFSVVKTDREGRFSIYLNPRARFVTVYTPSGYHNTNRFFTDVRGLLAGRPEDGGCLHRSNSTFEFGLIKASESGSFAHMSDIEERSYCDWIDRLKDYVSLHNHDFIAITGDICYADGLKLMSRSLNDDNAGCRVVYTIGNHDLIKGNEDYLGNPYGEKNYEDCFGPSWYAFAVNGIHFIVTPMMMGDARPSYSRDDVMKWIEAYMSVIPEDAPMVIFNHDANSSLIPASGNVKAFIYGHHHTDYHTVSDTGIPFYCTMASNKAGNDHSPAALREIDFSKDGIISSNLRYSPISNHIVAHIVSEGGVNRISAVVYDEAADVCSVKAIMPDGSETELKRRSDFMWDGSFTAGVEVGSARVVAEFSDGGRKVKRVEREPALRWINSIGSMPYLSNPLLSCNTIYVAAIDNDMCENCGVYAISAEDGSRKWFFKSGNSIQGDIALVDGVIYAGDADYNIYALNAFDGSLKWTKRTARNFYPSMTEGIHVDGGLVFFGSGKNLCALNAEDGSLVWKNHNEHGTITNVGTNRTTAGALLTNGYWVGRFCYDQKNGDLLWEKKEYQSRYSTCTPAVVDTTFIYAGYSSLIQVGARSGKVLKSREFSTIFNVKSEPLVTGGKIFIGSSRDGIFAANLDDFSQAWQYQCEPALIYTSPYTKNREKTVECSPVAWKDNIIIGANDGFVYCLAQSNGRFVWRINIGLPVVNKLMIDGDNLIVIDFDGNVYCYDLNNLK